MTRREPPAGLPDAELEEPIAEGEAAADEWPPLVQLDAAYELPSFPTHALPDGTRQFVEALAEATQTPPDLAAGLVLGVFSAAVANVLEVEARDGWIEPLALFLLVALDPGNRKTGVAREVAAPLRDAERRLREELAPKVRDAEIRRRALEKAIAETEKRASKAEDDGERDAEIRKAQKLAAEREATPSASLPRLTADDATPEALGALMADCGERIAIISSESDFFEIIAGRYSHAPNIGLFLAGHAGDSVRVDRVNRPPIALSSPAITISISTQPEVTNGLAAKPGFAGRGLLSRFLYSIPESTLGRRRLDPPSVPRHIRRRYHEIIAALIDGLGLPGEEPPRRLYLRPEAREALDEFRAEIEPKMAAGIEAVALTGWLSKLPGAVVRIAGILHAAAHPGQIPEFITGDTMRGAIEIGRYFEEHARAAFDSMGAVRELADARAVWNWIERERLSSFTVAEARIGNRARIGTLDRTQAAIGVLADHGLVREGDRPKGGRGKGRPSPRFEVNPLAGVTGVTGVKAPSAYSGNSGYSGEGAGEKNESPPGDALAPSSTELPAGWARDPDTGAAYCNGCGASKCVCADDPEAEIDALAARDLDDDGLDPWGNAWGDQ